MNDCRKRHEKRLKRERKKRERRRQDQRRPNPGVAVCGHDADVPITSGLVLSVWEALRGGRVVGTVPAHEMGEDRKCWHNVRRLVERHGGEMVLGWSVCDVPLRSEIRPQKNRFARVALNAHAVWFREGRFHETCPERLGKGMRFLLAGPAAVMCDATIEFLDTAGDAAAVEWPVMSFAGRPLTARMVDLRSPVLSVPAATVHEADSLIVGTSGEVFNAAGRVGIAIPAQGMEGAIPFEIDAIHPPGIPAGNPGWVQVLIAGKVYCRINPELCRPPYHRLADCVLMAHRHRKQLPLGGSTANKLVLPPAPHPEAQEIIFWKLRLMDGEVVMVDTPERVRRMGGRA